MKEKKIKNGITYVILGIVGVVMLFPVIWMFFACFKTNNEIFGSLSLLPQGWSPEAFIKGWKTTGTYTYAQYFIILSVPCCPVPWWLTVLPGLISPATSFFLWC